MKLNKTPSYYDLKAMILKEMGHHNEAKEMLKVERTRHRKMFLFAVERVYDRQTANREAARMDNKLLLDFPLFRSYAPSSQSTVRPNCNS